MKINFLIMLVSISYDVLVLSFSAARIGSRC